MTMDDAYTPVLGSFAFTADETVVITSAFETEKPWAWKSNDPLYEIMERSIFNGN